MNEQNTNKSVRLETFCYSQPTLIRLVLIEQFVNFFAYLQEEQCTREEKSREKIQN